VGAIPWLDVFFSVSVTIEGRSVGGEKLAKGGGDLGGKEGKETSWPGDSEKKSRRTAPGA